MKYNTNRFVCVLFVGIIIFFSGLISSYALAQIEENVTKTNIENTVSNSTSINTDLTSPINNLDTTIQNLDYSSFQEGVDPTLVKNTLHYDLEEVKHLISDGEYSGAFNGLVNTEKKIQAFVKPSSQDKFIPIIYQIIESVQNKLPSIEQKSSNFTRSYDTHSDVPIQTVYQMRTVPVTQVDITIQNLDDSYFVDPILAKNTLHSDLENVKYAILGGNQYATYSILVNMTKEIQGQNLVTSSGQNKILPMIDALIESVKIETTPISPAPSAQLESYHYIPNPEEPWKISPWVVIVILVIAVAGWTMFAIYRTRSGHP
jgi:hypothetical protein